LVFKTIPNENNLSGLSISNIFSVNKEAEAESARQLQENLKRLNDYQKGIDELNKTTATSTEYTKLWNNTMVGADADVQAYAKNIKAGTGSVEAYTTAQKEAATATEGVGTASKIAAVGMNALKIAANVAIVTLISWGIEKLVEYVSNLKSASEKAKEELDTAIQSLNSTSTKVADLNTKLQDTNKQIETLQSKGSLTFVEQGQLTTLEQTSAQLQTQLEIQQALQKIAKEKQTSAAIKSINVQSDEKINPFTGAVNTDNNIKAKSGMDGVNETLAFYSDRLSQVNKDQKEYNALVAKGNNLTDEEKQKKETLNYILKDEDDAGTALKENLLNRAKAYQEEADAIDIDSTSNREDAKQKKQFATDMANSILKVVDAENYAKSQTDKFNSVWKDDSYKKELQGLADLAQQGKLTEQTLQGAKYSSFVKALSDVGISAKDAANEINALSKEELDNAGTTDSTTTSLDKLSSKYKDLSDKLSTLQSIQDSYNEVGYISAGMLTQLTANNGELLQYIDIVNGKLVINTSVLQDNADKIKAQMTETVQATLASQIFGIMQDDVKTKTKDAGDATNTAKGQISDMDTTMRNAAIGAQVLAGGYNAVKDAFKGIPGSNTDLSADAQTKIKKAIANAKAEADTISKISISSPKEDNKHKKEAKSAAKNTATNAKEAAKKAAEEAKSAAKEAYENELSNLQNNEDSGLYKTKLDFYNALVKFQAKWIKNSYIDNSTKNSLKKKITEALKDYEQDVYDISLKQLSHREEIGQTKSGSIQELQNLQAIYKNLTTNPLMQLVNDDEHRQEINEKIYQNKKQSLENEREELNTEKDLGQIEEGSLEYVNRLKSIKADIEKSDLNAIDKAEKLSDIDKDIYSATQSYNEAQINAVDHLVNIGKLQSNSLEYLKRLNHLYHTLNLSLDDRKSLQEKIFSSEISYISQLKSDLSDELIEGSYGQRIKEYEDEIDDLQQKESDLSDETISNSLGSQIKAIQDKIDAINDQSEAESKALALEKAKAAWEEAQNNKTVQIYTNKNGFVYQADQSAVTEKKQSYAEAQRNEEIEKLTQQKDALQKMLDSEKNSIEVSIKALTKHKESLQSDLQSEQTELEKATKVLQGYDVNSDDLWDDIQNQIDDVLNEVTGNISESTNKHKASYDEENESVTNLTDNTTNSYQSQIKNAQDFIVKFTPVNQQIMDMYNQQANAAQKIADAIYNVNNELDRYIRVINDAENEREEMNEQYNEYNQEARENHQSVHYASGTEDSINGLVKKNEQGYELTFEPTDNGNYEILKEHSKVLTASQTQRIFDLAKGVSPQIATLKANLSLGKIGGNISNRTTKTDITNKYEIKKVEFPNATNKDEIQAAFGSLDLYFKQKAFSNE
jgi:chromosome segregation ATPase